MLTLFDDVFSPYARKVRIALYEKGVPFERVRALHGDCNRTDFVDVNPRAEVPALIEDGFALYDSTVICEYLEDRHPAPRPVPGRRSPPCQVPTRGRPRRHPARRGHVRGHAGGVRASGKSTQRCTRRRRRDMGRLYDEFERLLGDSEFFCGTYSIADIAVVPHLAAASFLGFGLDSEPSSATPRVARAGSGTARDRAGQCGRVRDVDPAPGRAALRRLTPTACSGGATGSSG